MNDPTLQTLNQHPLNQAALRRLEREGHRPIPNLMHLLDLAHLGNLDDRGEAADDRLHKLLGDWGHPAPQRQNRALKALEHDLTPDFLERANLERIASQIRDSLETASGYPAES